MDKQLELVFTQGFYQVFKEKVEASFFYTYNQYWYKIIGGNNYKGPFQTREAAIINLEAMQRGIIAPNDSPGPNLIKVDFVRKKRAK